MSVSPSSSGPQLSSQSEDVLDPLEAAGEIMLPHGWPHACEVHEVLPAIATCKRCGRMLCVICRTISPLDQFSYCPLCQAQLMVENAQPLSPVEQRAEELAGLNAPGSLEPQSLRDVPSTIWSALRQPSPFFAALSSTGGITAALFVAILCNLLGTIFLLVWMPTLPEGTELLLAQVQAEAGVTREIFLLGLFIALPFITAIEILLYAFAMHGTLQFFGHRMGPFRLTFKVVAYSFVARLLLVLPYIGQFAGSIYGVALLIMGVRYAHRAPLLKTAIAVLVPVLLFSGLSLIGVSG